jgi:hypothetical protein
MGHVFVEFDLAGAEWVVTAYLSRDPNMIGVVESGKSPHVVTGALIMGGPEELVLRDHELIGSLTDADSIEHLRLKSLPEYEEANGLFWPRSMSVRQAGKKSNHGCNYGMQYKRFAMENEMPETDAKPIVEMYSGKAYPGLKDNYWKETREILRNGRTMENCFGRKVKLLGEWGNDLFMAAYSFRPQSTVVDISNRAMCMIFEEDTDDFELVGLRAQVHDSLMIMHPTPTTEDEFIRMGVTCNTIMRDFMSPELTYGAFSFTLGVDMKVGTSWGKMMSLKDNSSPLSIAKGLMEVIPKLGPAAVDLSGQQLLDQAESEEWEAGEQMRDHLGQEEPALLVE